MLNNLYCSDCYNLQPTAAVRGRVARGAGGFAPKYISIMNMNIRVYLITLISHINTSLINLC